MRDNLGTTNMGGIDKALKMGILDVMHCLTSPKIVAEL